jgi:hypothetical protein
MIAFALAAALMAADVAPVAEAPPAPPAAATPPAEAAKPAAKTGEHVTCKMEPVLGSRLSRKICMTDEQRERMSRDARDATEQIQRGTPFAGPK